MRASHLQIASKCLRHWLLPATPCRHGTSRKHEQRGH